MLSRKKRRELVNKFGKIFVEFVRDGTLESIYNVLSGKCDDERDRKFSSLFSKSSEDQKALVKELLTRAVNSTMGNTFFLFDQYCSTLVQSNNCVIQLIYSENGEYFDINEVSDGLEGELYSTDGWIAKFSAYGDSIEPL
ncbi:MAG: hypothetical protein LBE13_16005 [Bacteroidales bacterium]|jgi:hypothetical protein|nr:hypothetical protein [Bacteroidales bacterium]